MTNKEYLLTLSDKELAQKILWLAHCYGYKFTDSTLAIEQWLGEEHIEIPGYINEPLPIEGFLNSFEEE